MAIFQEAEWESVVPLAEHWPSTGEIKFERYLSQAQKKLQTSGEIKFDGYATKYRPELPCVLENFNLDVSDNEKVETLMLKTRHR